MPTPVSLLDELRTQYEAARQSTQEHAAVEGFQQIDARLRKAFRWLEKAVTYLDGLKPAIDHCFDLGHNLVFESPRFGHGSVGQHERRIVGFPVLDGINIYYEISASNALALDVALANIDRLDRVTLEFHSNVIEEPVLEDLVRLILGRDSVFLRRAPLAGLHGRPSAAV